MASPRPGFIPDAQTQINELLRVADVWSTLQQEYGTFTANGITISDADVNAVIPGMTATAFNQTLAAMQWVVDMIHSTATTVGPTNVVSKLYRVRR